MSDIEKYAPHVHRSLGYAEDVVAGRVVTGELTRLACERFLTDLERDFEFHLDAMEAQRACAFIEMLPHIKGVWAKRREKIRLEAWQSFGLVNVFGWRDEQGLRRFRTAYEEVGRKNAKALDLDTDIPTPRGFKSLRDVQVNDVVFAADGRQVRVIEVSPVFLHRRCYEVCFSTGESVIADADHLWLTTARVDRPGHRSRSGYRHGESVKTRPRTTSEIAATLRYGARGDLNHSVAVAAAIELPERRLNIDPYVLGAWLGDGHSSGGRISSADEEVLDAITSAEGDVRRCAGTITYGIGPNYRDVGVAAEDTLHGRLRARALIDNKHIPSDYMRASVEQRRELLRGLLDTDGTISPAGQVTYCSMSERLASDVAELAATLGLKPSTSSGDAKLGGRVVGTAYRVQMWPTFPAFKIHRKLARQRSVRDSARSRTRTITDVREVPSRPTKCLVVEGGMFLVGRHMIPTHNSTKAAGVGLFMLCEDGEAGAEVYSAATTRDQAKIVFNVAREMARRTAELPLEVRVQSITHLDSASLFKALHAQGETLDGYNIQCALNDEVHAWKKRDVYDVIETAMGSRAQPLAYNITTAGNDTSGICWALRSYLVNILNGRIEDDRFFGIIYTLDKGDDWQDRDVWVKANPNYGVSVSPIDLENLARKAAEVVTQQNAFLTKRMNVWTSSAIAWMNMIAWNACFDPNLTIEAFAGETCWGGLDLASKIDVNSFAQVFRRMIDGQWHYYAFMKHWLPQAAVDEEPTGLYDGWARAGQIRVTPGNIIDTDRIEDDIMDEVVATHRLEELGVDPMHNSTQVSVHMAQNGVQTVDVRPTVLNFSEPMKWLEALVKDGRFHTNCPVLSWMVANVEVKVDFKDNIYPRKAAPNRKIDGVIALLIALNRAMSTESSYRPSEGVVVI